MKKRVHAFYSGRVQGVGFRITAEEAARQLGVVGWVRNLRDGRVELVAEEQETVLLEFLQAIRLGPMANFIQQAELEWSAWSGGFTDFQIRYFDR
ncbi:MAG: acylphosphatase [Candidatus Omnitrophica bacterium]|nr:acylphosphatase [Candidatus Omnitrophota bacterium]